MPSSEAAYRNFCLNQRVEMTAPFVARSVWNANNAAPEDSFVGYPVWAGLDLAETSDLCALVLVACIDEKWHVKPYFWLPEVGLIDKSFA